MKHRYDSDPDFNIKLRTTAITLAQMTDERVNSNLKDNSGGRFVRMRGANKVMRYLMFGLIVITAT